VPLSRDPEARKRSLANLRAGAGSGDGGLQRAIRHGAYAAVSEEDLTGKVRELVEAIGEDLPVREPDGGVPGADAIPLRLLGESLIRRERVRETEVRHGIEAADGKLRGVVEFGLRLDAQIIRLCVELGLTPRSRAALGLDLARAESAAARSLDADLAASREAWERHGDAMIDGDAIDETEAQP
jgi:hypothetical protein